MMITSGTIHLVAGGVVAWVVGWRHEWLLKSFLIRENLTRCFDVQSVFWFKILKIKKGFFFEASIWSAQMSASRSEIFESERTSVDRKQDSHISLRRSIFSPRPDNQLYHLVSIDFLILFLLLRSSAPAAFAGNICFPSWDPSRQQKILGTALSDFRRLIRALNTAKDIVTEFLK